MNTAVRPSSTYNLTQSRQQPHRKPLPAQPQPQQLQQSPSSRSSRSADRIQPLTKIRPDEPATTASAAQQQRKASHTHNRTTSSATLPPSSFNPPPSQSTASNAANNMYSTNYSYPQQGTRRTLSNATTSTASTNGGRKNSTSASTLQRTTSSRSGSSPTSYVALMRKQKATVWSDRAQHEDPRLIAQQRAAKMRAAIEVNSNPHAASSRVSTSGNSSITGGMRAKIRHHGAPKAQQYNPTPTAASGVPMRLSAREVDDEESEDDHLGIKPLHQRSSSGRSSVGSAGQRASSIYGPGQGIMTRGSSESNTPPQTRGTTTPAEVVHQRQRSDTQESTGAEPTPVPENFRQPDYFSPRASNRNQTPGSTNSAQENEFGSVGTLTHRVRDVKEGETNEDLQRRGSVDERTMTMRGYGRLFVANPDLDD